ncbi:hypothetical protein MKZ38_004566 [Zalerion maritima]|uniref:glucan endo-1,3-beta-D-glucosidase n=1 Tax=Zalerion maritima TaxID=339359 RepID=A0AAD5WXC7_9PEZI|nr:hypothetical protein MKZ38_004566 [Zalerion maritima]
MRYTVAAALLASTSFVVASDCDQDAYGNYYCSEIDHIVYSNVGGSGSYDVVSAMDTESGDCSFSSSSYSGNLAPLDEEVSLHVRGPVQLKAFAAYTPGSSSSEKNKRAARKFTAPKERRQGHGRHGHQHFHNKKRAAAAAEEHKNEKRSDVWVTATIDGQVVSWINDYNPGATTSTTAEAVAAAVATTTSTTAKATTTSSSSSSSSSSSDDDSSSSDSSTYSRVGYYNAEGSAADGVTFLGNYGGTGSGVWTSTFGNSLAYLSSDGTTGSSSSQVLDNVEITSNYEYSIWTDTECSDNEDCGYHQDGTVSYHGFDGADKVFIFEFTMPLDTSCDSTSDNCNMPAIWMLNSLIPRTGQYSSCSCWTSGCGEFDIYEVLYPGDLRAKTTFHTNTPGGSSDYFVRPTDDYIQVAVVFDSDSNKVGVKQISNFEYPDSLSKEDVTEMLGDSDSNVATFAISS